MKGTEILLGHVKDRAAAALIVDGTLEDVLVETDAPTPGTIYRARATRPVKGQGGMFFDTPDGSAFLRGAKGIASGETHLVQVSGYGEPGKAIPVTGKVLFKSRFAIVTPDAPGMNLSRAIKDEDMRGYIRAAAETELAEHSAHGVILRSSCEGAEADEIAEDVDAMLSLANAVLGDQGDKIEKLLDGSGPEEFGWREWPKAPVHETDLADMVDEVLQAECGLPGGGSIVIEPTRAFVAVDVNTGRDTSPAAGLKTNLATAKTLPRLLRIKGLGGQIVVDFAPMPKNDRRALDAALNAAFRKDSIETTLVGWTTLGHFELARKRARAPLHEVLR